MLRLSPPMALAASLSALPVLPLDRTPPALRALRGAVEAPLLARHVLVDDAGVSYGVVLHPTLGVALVAVLAIAHLLWMRRAAGSGPREGE